MAEFLCYSDAGRKTVIVTHSNAHFFLDKRDVEIRIEEGLPIDAVSSGKLGSFKLDTLERKCPKDASWVEIAEELGESDFSGLTAGIAKITARKRHAGRDYVNAKKIEALRTLNMQCEHIEKFNQDPDTPAGVRLTSNIWCLDGVSVLHAAVQMVDDRKLVAKLLRLGANPRARSKDGSPLNLAQQLCHRAKEKKDNLESKKAPIESIEAQMMRYLEAKNLVKMLQQHGTKEFQPLSTEKDSAADNKDTWLSGKIVLQGQESIDNSKVATAVGHLDDTLSEMNHDAHALSNPTSKATVQMSGSDVLSSSLTCGPVEVATVDASTTESSLTRGATDHDNVKLPILEKPEWVEAKFMKMCWKSNHCPYWAKGNCHFWHVQPKKCTNQNNSTHQLSCQGVPLSQRDIRVKEKHGFWTSAYLIFERKTIVYAQGGPPSCMVSKQGISWYPSKADAMHALECTMAGEEF